MIFRLDNDMMGSEISKSDDMMALEDAMASDDMMASDDTMGMAAHPNAAAARIIFVKKM
ncbi:MAG: hypothetical protein ACU0C9_00630 [Paracoccaceae bacterium]